MRTQSPELLHPAWLGSVEDDFPFYNGQPLLLTRSQWLMVLAAIAFGYACVTVPVPLLVSPVGLLIRTILFPTIPLLALRLVVGVHWLGIFRRLRGPDFFWMTAIATVNLVITVSLGAVFMKLFGAETNLAVSGLAEQSTSERELFFLRTIPQLFGEEVLTILPFLAVMTFGYNRLNLTRNRAILLAWLVSSLMFGLVHLPTYNWNLLQCIVVIGSARLILTLAYLKTRNILVSTGAHILNDWAIFGIVILGSGPAGG